MLWFKKKRVPAHDFEHIRNSLQGMLPAKVYREYYRIARDVSKASILELGTGQGASTVSFALGIKDAGRAGRVIAVDQFSQHVQGPHPASLETDGEATVDINLGAFEAGLGRFRVQDVVDIYAGTTEDVAESVRAEIGSGAEAGRADVLAIDVDGILDRDLALFYDCIPRNGILILDDYADSVNRRGQSALERYRRWSRDVAAEKVGVLSSFQRRRLLGKHLLTFRLVERFEALGLLAKENLIGSTVFCRKTGDRAFGECWTGEESAAIERSIVDDFLSGLHGNAASAG